MADKVKAQVDYMNKLFSVQLGIKDIKADQAVMKNDIGYMKGDIGEIKKNHKAFVDELKRVSDEQIKLKQKMGVSSALLAVLTLVSSIIAGWLGIRR